MEFSVFRRGVAEFVGTFTLIFIGGGAGIEVAVHGAGMGFGGGLVAVALANGLAIGIMVSNLGHISGGHFNPAITLGFLATRRIAPLLAVWYWVFQLAGGTVAALGLRWIFHQPAFGGAVPNVSTAVGFGSGRGLVV
ncbi:MAG TPA: aquaporin, partial [Gaiellaceae bacterium]|nr:aquaporin [Gaiellaceae bacterium]